MLLQGHCHGEVSSLPSPSSASTRKSRVSLLLGARDGLGSHIGMSHPPPPSCRNLVTCFLHRCCSEVIPREGCCLSPPLLRLHVEISWSVAYTKVASRPLTGRGVIPSNPCAASGGNFLVSKWQRFPVHMTNPFASAQYHCCDSVTLSLSLSFIARLMKLTGLVHMSSRD
jgi:hypothetical protein